MDGGPDGQNLKTDRPGSQSLLAGRQTAKVHWPDSFSWQVRHLRYTGWWARWPESKVLWAERPELFRQYVGSLPRKSVVEVRIP